MKRFPFACLSLLLGAALLPAGETVRCPAVRDADVSCDDPSEKGVTYGGRPRMKLKGWKQFALADFDLKAVQGRRILEASLLIRSAGNASDGGNGGLDVRWMTVSTVGRDWEEASISYNEPAKGADWGFRGAQIYDVALGNGHTLRQDAQSNADGEAVRLRLDPRLAMALAAGASHGLLIMDGTAGIATNNYIVSREGGQGPVLEVVLDGADKAPAKPSGLEVKPEPNQATEEFGALRVTLKVPENAFAYRIRVAGKEVLRWQIPFAAKAGETQTFVLQDLAPDAETVVEVVAVSGGGLTSAPAEARGRVSPRITVPDLPPVPFEPKAGEPKSLGGAKVYAFPEVTKVLPTTGAVHKEPGMEDFKRRNPVWEGATGTIRLAGARAEILSFQIGFDGAVSGCAIQVSDLSGAGTIPAEKNVRLWRNWYVGSQSEYALPLAGPISCPMPDNAVAGQKHQAVTVDYAIPKDAKPGVYKGSVRLTAGANTVELPLSVKVYSAVIPDESHFNPELNAYRSPGEPGSEQFKESHRLAQYHRACLTVVPYGHRAGSHPEYCPEVDAAGNPTDWSRFDRNLAGLLDGSWFQDNPRAGVPVSAFYLPIHEGWPLDFRKHYDPGCPVPASPSDPGQRLAHHIRAKPFRDSVDESFQEGIVNCTRGFVRHAKEKGWTRTQFQAYLNGKHSFNYTLWLLDEPSQAIDWMVLNDMAALFRKGFADPESATPAFFRDLFEKGLGGMKRGRPTFLFRGDISRPMWQGSCSDGLMGILYANNEHFTMRRLIRDMRKRAPMIVKTYGGPNGWQEANWGSVAWCLQAYVCHSDGVLPWQSIGGEERLTQPDNDDGFGLIIESPRHGRAIASFRLHAMRRGAQDCELLRLLQLQRGWDREHIGVLVAKKVPVFDSEFRQRFQDEAAGASYANLTSRGFAELREGVLQLLEKAPAPAAPPAKQGK